MVQKTTTVESALRLAKAHAAKGNVEKAQHFYSMVLTKYPQNQTARKGLKTLQNNAIMGNRPDLGQQEADLAPQEISDLLALYSAGKLNEALNKGQRLCQVNPTMPLLHNTLGAIHVGLGKLDAAVASYERALELKPDYAEAHNNLGNALRVLGRLDAAVASYEQALIVNPDYIEARYNLGCALRGLGQLDAAVASCERALKLAKTNQDTLQNKVIRENQPDLIQQEINDVIALYSVGKLNEALRKGNQLSQINPKVPLLHNTLGAIFAGLGKPNAAIASYQRSLKLKPDYAEVHNNLGDVLRDLGQLDAALASCKRALELKPNYAEAHYNLGNVLRDLDQMDAAVVSYKRALELKPDYAEAHCNLAFVSGTLGNLNAAVASCERALKFKPDLAEAHNNLGNALRELGRLDAAMASCKRALDLKPDYAEAHYNLSFLKTFKPDDVHIELMESLVSRSEISKPDRIKVCFALGKANDDLGEYEKSIHYLNEGNRLRKNELKYNVEQYKQLISKIKDIFSAERPLVDIAKPGQPSSIRPVFIVGMPRSGTSLVEQILASHTQVHGAGELETMNKLLNPILSPLPDEMVGECKMQITQNDINTLRDDYLNALTALRNPEKIITDKMPLNFFYIGFIVSAFPEAKIINLNRDPRATCWSIYKTYFSTRGNGYAHDLDDLAEFYNLYIELMSFWRACFPNRVYDIGYEDLTENQEKETRKLLEFCGLEWEDGCLDFHKTKRVVRTASGVQVRQKMYKGSSEAWKKYEAHLQPLIKALGY